MTQRERQILNWIEADPTISQQELADRAGITRSSVAVHISNLMKKGCIAGKGYIVTRSPYVTVVGGMNMDIGGRPNQKLVGKDSNPGTVRMSPGGVGRNIAHNMSLMGLDVRLVTAFGDDVYAQKLAAVCGELGIDISQSPVIPGGHTSTYLFINDEEGDMQLAVSDMDIYENLTPRVLESRRQLLDGSQVVVLDTNLPSESIQWVAENCRAPIFADPVSTAKAEKLRPVLGKLHTLKPNRLETELLSGVPITDDDSLCRAADALLETGLHRVFISLGADGVFAADHSGQKRKLPALKGNIVSTTGCGDAFMAALAWAYLQGRPGGVHRHHGQRRDHQRRHERAGSAGTYVNRFNKPYQIYNVKQEVFHYAEPLSGHCTRGKEGPGRGQARCGPGKHHHLPWYALSPE